jgi:hypothetical protein
MKHSAEYERFTNLVDRVLAVPHNSEKVAEMKTFAAQLEVARSVCRRPLRHICFGFATALYAVALRLGYCWGTQVDRGGRQQV